MSQLNDCKDEDLKKDLKNKLISSIDCEDDELIGLDTILTQLDGIYDDVDRIILATTNNLDKISKPMLRPGRFDLKLELGHFVTKKLSKC